MFSAVKFLQTSGFKRVNLCLQISGELLEVGELAVVAAAVAGAVGGRTRSRGTGHDGWIRSGRSAFGGGCGHGGGGGMKMEGESVCLVVKSASSRLYPAAASRRMTEEERGAGAVRQAEEGRYTG